MYRRTGEFYGVNESLFSSALAAMIFSILGAQPLTIVGITGLISLFNYTIYDIVVIYEPTIYPNFMCWVAIWGAIFHWIVAVCNLCDYMRYVTDFSSESFGAYVGIIYCSTFLHLFTFFTNCINCTSQRSGRARKRVHRLRRNSWVLKLSDCHSLLPDYIRSGMARVEHNLPTLVQGTISGLRLCGMSTSLFYIPILSNYK